MNIQSLKMRIFSLLMVAALMIVISVATPQDLEQIPIWLIAENPSSYIGRIIRISGVLKVLKEQAYIRDDDHQISLNAWIAFEEGWKERSPKSAVKELDKLRRKSGTSWPYRGSSVIQLDYRDADVELEGVLIANSEYRNPENEHFDADNFTLMFPINNSPYVFNVHRILSLREKKESTK